MRAQRPPGNRSDTSDSMSHRLGKESLMAARAYWQGQIRLALVSIPVEVYSAVKSGAAISFRQIHEPTGKPIQYEKVVAGVGPVDRDEIIKGHAENYDLEPQLVAAVIYQESKFDAGAVSSSGAVGLMQLLPSTGQGIADRTGGNSWTPEDLRDPELNIRYGSWYLRHLLDKYGDEQLALAAYNAGQTNVDSWREQGVGIQFPETRHYVARVQELKRIYARAYAEELGPR